MKNNYFEIKDVQEDESNISFTFVNYRDKVLRIRAIENEGLTGKEYAVMVRPYRNATISCDKSGGMWKIWQHVLHEDYTVEELETSFYCLVRAAHEFRWPLLDSPNGEKLLGVPLIGIEGGGFVLIPEQYLPQAAEVTMQILSRWSVKEDDDGGIDFRKYSPAGEDFGFYIHPCDDVVQAVLDYTLDFDEEEHVAMWISARCHGSTSGIPSAPELVKDAAAIHQMLDDLAGAFLVAKKGWKATQPLND